MADITILDLDKTDVEVMRRYLKKHGLPSAGNAKVLATRLGEYYDPVTFDIAECTTCGGQSAADLDECPYCGDSGEVEESVARGPQSGAPEPDSESPDEPGVAKPSDAPAETPESPSEPVIEESVAVDEPAGKPAPRKARRKAPAKDAPAKDAPAKASKPVAKSRKAPGAAKGARKSKAKPAADLAEAPPTEVLVVDDLDEQIAAVRKAKEEGAVAMWRIGAAAKVINDGQLWKLRTNGRSKKPKYGSFGQFCTEELGMDRSSVYRAIKVAETYTEEECRGLSGRAVRVAYILPEGKREELLDAARNGKSGAELSTKAKELMGEPPPTPSEPPPHSVSIAVALGEQVVDCFARPKTPAKVGDTEDATPAMGMADDPWFRVEFANDVQMIGKLIAGADGHLQVALTLRRGTAAL